MRKYSTLFYYFIRKIIYVSSKATLDRTLLAECFTAYSKLIPGHSSTHVKSFLTRHMFRMFRFSPYKPSGNYY